VQGRLRIHALEACGDGATVHDVVCGREAENGNSVGCIGGCVGRQTVRILALGKWKEGGARRTVG